MLSWLVKNSEYIDMYMYSSLLTQSATTELPFAHAQSCIAHTLVGARTTLGIGACQQNDGD